jgi:precorrin-2 dehydrogenase/sirohydrochlorin ferrochelatase
MFKYNGPAMAKYPIFLKMTGRRVVIIGGGAVAYRKAKALIDTGARLVIVAPKASEPLTLLCQEAQVELIRSRYSKQYLGSALLVIAATNNPSLNHRIFEDCQELEILCNVVDQPELCDFFAPALVKRLGLQIAISTEGYCPAYASHIRKKIEKLFTENHGRFLDALERMRQSLMASQPEPSDRKVILGELVSDRSFDVFVQQGLEAWQQYAHNIISQQQEKTPSIRP